MSVEARVSLSVICLMRVIARLPSAGPFESTSFLLLSPSPLLFASTIHARGGLSEWKHPRQVHSVNSTEQTGGSYHTQSFNLPQAPNSAMNGHGSGPSFGGTREASSSTSQSASAAAAALKASKRKVSHISRACLQCRRRSVGFSLPTFLIAHPAVWWAGGNIAGS